MFGHLTSNKNNKSDRRRALKQFFGRVLLLWCYRRVCCNYSLIITILCHLFFRKWRLGRSRKRCDTFLSDGIACVYVETRWEECEQSVRLQRRQHICQRSSVQHCQHLELVRLPSWRTHTRRSSERPSVSTAVCFLPWLLWPVLYLLCLVCFYIHKLKYAIYEDIVGLILMSWLNIHVCLWALMTIIRSNK